MDASEIHAIAKSFYGPQWQSALAREMGVNVRTVQRWAANGVDRPAMAQSIRRFVETRRREIIPPPPVETTSADDRDDAIYTAMRPTIEALIISAITAGWHPAEATFGALNIAVDIAREGAGIPATIEILSQGIASLREEQIASSA